MRLLNDTLITQHQANENKKNVKETVTALLSLSQNFYFQIDDEMARERKQKINKILARNQRHFKWN